MITNNLDYSFDTLKKLFNNYMIYENKNYIIDKSNGSAIFDPKIVTKAKFALLWQSCPELPRKANTDAISRSSKTCPDAWNEDAKEVYDTIMEAIITPYPLPFSVATGEIYEEVKKCSGKHKDDLFNNIFFNEKYMKGSTEERDKNKSLITSFFRDAFDSSRQSKQSSNTQTQSF